MSKNQDKADAGKALTNSNEAEMENTNPNKDCGCGCEDCEDSQTSASTETTQDCSDCNSKRKQRVGLSGTEKPNLVKEFTPETNAVLLAGAAATAPAGKPVPPTKVEPGKWVPLPQQQGVDPDTARQQIESRTPPSNIYKPGAKPLPSGVKALAGGLASNTVGGPVSISELARALRNNVDLIYEWVFNNIEHQPTYGIQKGGLGSIIDGIGNSFDQADLMVQLLRQAGYTSNYQFGTLRMNAAQLGAWLGTDPLNIWASYNFLVNSGVPAAVVNVSGTDYVEFSHCWLICNISGTNYVFDPSQKTYTAKTGVNLATAMGFNATTFMNNARSGATITANYVQNLNRTNIRNDLDSMTNTLVNWIKTNNHGAGMDDILGGRTINQNDSSTPLRQTAHPFLKPATTPTTWTSIPQAYKATMHIVYDTIDVTFNTEDLAGKRLTLFFNVSHQAELRLDGTLIGTSTAQTPGTWNSVLFDIVHPYAGTWANQYQWMRVWADKPYLLCNSWGNMSASAASVHSKNIKALDGNYADPGSEEMVGETMAQMWKVLGVHSTRMLDITNRMADCSTVLHHQCGLIGHFDTFFLDIGAVVWATSALDNDYNKQQANDTTFALHGVALESQIVRETFTILGVSTTALVDSAVASGQKIYDGKTANWTASVKPNLVNYNAGDLTDIENWYINNGYRVGIPENGQITIGNWTGYGYYAIPSYGTFGLIGGGLKGGSGERAQSLTLSPYYMTWNNFDFYLYGDIVDKCDTIHAVDNESTCVAYEVTSLGLKCMCSVPAGSMGYWGNFYAGGGNGAGGGGGGGTEVPGIVTSAEPIDLASGAYILDATDISIGGLSFSRSYNSAAKDHHGPLGRGWRHSFDIFCNIDTSGGSGMGEQTVIGASGTIVEAYVTYQLQTDLTKPFDKYLTCAVANKWFVDNLSHNIVTLQAGFSRKTFVKLPNGTYANPVGENGTLTRNVDGTFTYTSLTGEKLNFNSRGHISTMQDTNGNTVTFTYTDYVKLSSVADSFGRTLTISYTNNRISSVSDGTGRSVGYTVNGVGDLVTVTDPNGKNWTYEYAVPGQMTKLYKPANPSTTIVTNVYDTLGRVKEQKDYQNNTWQYFFAGSRTEEVNPNSKSSIMYWGNMGSVVKSVNQVGKKSLTQFDGRNRPTKVIAPEGNSVEFVYDSKDRVTQTTVKAKPSSGLADIVTSATYDATWGKLKTATDNLGRVTTMNYDAANGNLLSVVSPSVTGLGSSTVTMTYTAKGQIETVTAPDGIVSKCVYDPTYGHVTSKIADFGVGRLNLTTNFGYNSRGWVTSTQDPRGNSGTIDYDVLGRVTQVTGPAPFSYVTKFTYDDNGNKTKIEVQTNDPDNPWQTTQASYTADGKVLTTTSPTGVVTTFTYDTLQRHWKTTDALSRVVTKVYDDANRISSIINPAAITEVTYTYTDNGKLATLKDARNYTTSYSFDGHDRPLRTTYPDSTYEEVSSYDGNSNPLTLRTRSGATVTLTYDELNRVKTKTPTGQPTVTTVYDIAGRVVTVSTPVVAGDPSSGTFTNYYDTAGRFYREQYPDGLSVTHVLDANGNMTKTTYPDGYYVERVYDQMNRQTDIKLNGSATSAIQFQYDALSRRNKLIYENGCVTNYGFEDDNDLSGILQNFVGSSVAFGYSFDDVGQMVSQRVSDPVNYRWTPGSAGTVTYGTANNINQYPTVGGTGFTYSTDGNLTNDGVYKYEFNTERMLTRVRNAGTNAIIADYLYDPALRQRQKNVGGTKTNYYYAGWQRLADYDGTTNALQQRYVYGSGLDEVLIQVTSGGTKTYFHSNHQGSIVAVTDSSGAVLNRFRYGPYGESSALSGTSHGYTGQRYDSETGLYYYKMRHYSPKLGRFLQADPIAYGGGLNFYSYVGNSPNRMTDSSGLAADGSSSDLGTIPAGGFSFGNGDRSDNSGGFLNFQRVNVPSVFGNFNVAYLAKKTDHSERIPEGFMLDDQSVHVLHYNSLINWQAILKAEFSDRGMQFMSLGGFKKGSILANGKVFDADMAILVFSPTALYGASILFVNVVTQLERIVIKNVENNTKGSLFSASYQYDPRVSSYGAYNGYDSRPPHYEAYALTVTMNWLLPQGPSRPPANTGQVSPNNILGYAGNVYPAYWNNLNLYAGIADPWATN